MTLWDIYIRASEDDARRMQHALIRFHEIGLKGKNRPMFIQQLVANLRRATVGLGVRKVWSTRMVIRLAFDDNADWDAISNTIRNVPGAVKFANVQRADREFGAITTALMIQAKNHPFDSFRITANRADKRFPIKSNELNIRLGALVESWTGARVDLKNPDVEFKIDVLPEDAFVWTDEILGMGGLPVGTSGRITALMSGGIDSPVAAWRMMRRGCRASLVHFHSFPLVEGRSRDKARELAQQLNRYQYDTKLFLVPFAEVQRNLIVSMPGPLRVIAYRRCMIRIAAQIAQAEGARALVTGESLGQVSSQTLTNMATVGEVSRLPILRPLVGMDKREIIEQAEAIGTFATSIQPDEDCCTLFVPKSPSTAVLPAQIELYEKEVDITSLVDKAVQEAELVEYHTPRS